MSKLFPRLFQPLELRHKVLKNQLIFGAHTANMAGTSATWATTKSAPGLAKSGPLYQDLKRVSQRGKDRCFRRAAAGTVLLLRRTAAVSAARLFHLLRRDADTFAVVKADAGGNRSGLVAKRYLPASVPGRVVFPPDADIAAAYPNQNMRAEE